MVAISHILLSVASVAAAAAAAPLEATKAGQVLAARATPTSFVTTTVRRGRVVLQTSKLATPASSALSSTSAAPSPPCSAPLIQYGDDKCLTCSEIWAGALTCDARGRPTSCKPGMVLLVNWSTIAGGAWGCVVDTGLPALPSSASTTSTTSTPPSEWTPWTPSASPSAAPSAPACASDSTLRDGKCVKCNTIYMDAVTCDVKVPLSCPPGMEIFEDKNGWWSKPVGCRVPPVLPPSPCPSDHGIIDNDGVITCFPCATRFPHSLTCHGEAATTCEPGYALGEYRWVDARTGHFPQACVIY